MTTNKFMVVNPRNGLRIREATETETAAYLTQPVRHSSFRQAVMVGEVLVDEDNGPGMWYGGAGF